MSREFIYRFQYADSCEGGSTHTTLAMNKVELQRLMECLETDRRWFCATGVDDKMVCINLHLCETVREL